MQQYLKAPITINEVMYISLTYCVVKLEYNTAFHLSDILFLGALKDYKYCVETFTECFPENLVQDL